MGDQIFKNRLLDGLAFSRRLDHQIALAQLCKCLGCNDSFERSVTVCFGYLTAANLTVEVAGNGINRLLQCFSAYIVQQHVVARQSHNMGDAVAHLACANDADCLDIHALSPFVSPQHKAGGVAAARVGIHDSFSQIRTLRKSKILMAILRP